MNNLACPCNDAVSLDVFPAFQKHILWLVASAFLFRFCALAFPSINTPFQMAGIAVSAVSAILVCRHSKLVPFEYAYLLSLLGIVLLEGAYTIGWLGQTPYHFFSAAYSYSFCLLVFPCSFLLQMMGGRDFLDSLQKTAFFIALFLFLAAILKNTTGIALIEAFRERGGKARFSESELVDIMIIYCCWKACSGKAVVADYLFLIIGLLDVFLVSQTRVMEATVFIACFATLFACFKGANQKVLLLCVCFFIAFAGVAAGVLNVFIDSFSLTGLEASSTVARQEEFAFYLSSFFSNPILGVGMIAYESPLHYLVGGPYGNFFPDDIGIIGGLGTIGYLIFPLYIFPVCVFFKRLFHMRPENRPIHFGFIAYLLGTSATLLIAYPFCSPAWPLLVSLFFHYE